MGGRNRDREIDGEREREREGGGGGGWRKVGGWVGVSFGGWEWRWEKVRGEGDGQSLWADYLKLTTSAMGQPWSTRAD